MGIRTETIVVTLTGATGSQQSTKPISGEVLAVNVVYGSIASGNTDVTVATLGSSSPAVTILGISNSNTNTGWLYPRVGTHTTAGVALTYDATEPVGTCIPVDDIVVVTVADADAGTITAYIKYRS